MMYLNWQSVIRSRMPTVQDMARRCLLALAVLVLGAAAANAQTTNPPAMAPAVDKFQAGGGRPIRVERLDPPGEDKKHPALVVLHGVEGLDDAGPLFRRYAELFARQGYVVLLVHYFDRSDLAKKDLVALQQRFRHYFDPRAVPTPEESKQMERHFADWIDTVHQAVTYAGQRPNVERRRLGLVGFSLGAALALAAAAQDDPQERRVAAVVELFGGLPRARHAEIKTLPPTLMIHGDRDDCIPAWQAYKLEQALRESKLPIEFKMYQRVGHCFFPARELDLLDAVQRVGTFLQKHLQEQRGDKKAPSQREPSP